MNYIGQYESPIGVLTITTNKDKLTGIWFCEADAKRNYKELLKEETNVMKETFSWLDTYFEGKEPEFEVPFELKGTAFRMEVWKILCEIPYGETITYGEIAKKMAKKLGKEKMSAQAVGGAVGHNPISIMIPCHRVIGMNGNLTGYAGGIERKRKLMEFEHMDMRRFHDPK